MRPWIDIAVLTHTKGLKGGLVAHAAAGLPLLLSEGMELALVPPVLDAPRNVHVASVAPCGDDEALVLFDEVPSIEEASPLVGCHCLARRDDLGYIPDAYPDDTCAADADPAEARAVHADPDDDAVLPAWQGWRAYDGEAGLIGVIERIDDRPGQPLIVIARETGSPALVPLADDLVVSVDEDARRLDLACPRGLLDL